MSEVRELHIAAEMPNLAAIAAFVVDCCQDWHVGQQDTFHLELAIDEAATNIIAHAYRGEGGRLLLRCWTEGRDLCVQLHDWGEPFDPAQERTPRIDGALRERTVGGWGLFFMRQVMDEVRFSFDALGNHLFMRKRGILP